MEKLLSERMSFPFLLSPIHRESTSLRGTAGDHKGPPSHSSPLSPLREGKSLSRCEWLVEFVLFFHYVFGAYTCIVIGLIPKLV